MIGMKAVTFIEKRDKRRPRTYLSSGDQLIKPRSALSPPSSSQSDAPEG